MTSLISRDVTGVPPRDVTAQQCPVNRQPAAATVPLHRHLRSARHAALWRQVQLRGAARQASQQLRLVLAVSSHRLSGLDTLIHTE